MEVNLLFKNSKSTHIISPLKTISFLKNLAAQSFSLTKESVQLYYKNLLISKTSDNICLKDYFYQEIPIKIIVKGNETNPSLNSLTFSLLSSTKESTERDKRIKGIKLNLKVLDQKVKLLNSENIIFNSDREKYKNEFNKLITLNEFRKKNRKNNSSFSGNTTMIIPNSNLNNNLQNNIKNENIFSNDNSKNKLNNLFNSFVYHNRNRNINNLVINKNFKTFDPESNQTENNYNIQEKLIDYCMECFKNEINFYCREDNKFICLNCQKKNHLNHKILFIDGGNICQCGYKYQKSLIKDFQNSEIECKKLLIKEEENTTELINESIKKLKKSIINLAEKGQKILNIYPSFDTIDNLNKNKIFYNEKVKIYSFMSMIKNKNSYSLNENKLVFDKLQIHEKNYLKLNEEIDNLRTKCEFKQMFISILEYFKKLLDNLSEELKNIEKNFSDKMEESKIIQDSFLKNIKMLINEQKKEYNIELILPELNTNKNNNISDKNKEDDINLTENKNKQKLKILQSFLENVNNVNENKNNDHLEIIKKIRNSLQLNDTKQIQELANNITITSSNNSERSNSNNSDRSSKSKNSSENKKEKNNNNVIKNILAKNNSNNSSILSNQNSSRKSSLNKFNIRNSILNNNLNKNYRTRISILDKNYYNSEILPNLNINTNSRNNYTSNDITFRNSFKKNNNEDDDRNEDENNFDENNYKNLDEKLIENELDNNNLNHKLKSAFKSNDNQKSKNLKANIRQSLKIIDDPNNSNQRRKSTLFEQNKIKLNVFNLLQVKKKKKKKL